MDLSRHFRRTTSSDPADACGFRFPNCNWGLPRRLPPVCTRRMRFSAERVPYTVRFGEFKRWSPKTYWSQATEHAGGVDRPSFMQEDNTYCLENVQINKLNAYLQFKLNYDVCYTHESCLCILQACVVQSCPWLIQYAVMSWVGVLHAVQVFIVNLKTCFLPIIKLNWHNFLAITYYRVIFISVLL
jgi:hypothetical protein